MADSDVGMGFFTGTEDPTFGGDMQEFVQMTGGGKSSRDRETVTWIAAGGEGDEADDTGELHEGHTKRGVSVLVRGAGRHAFLLAGGDAGPSFGRVSSRLMWLDAKFDAADKGNLRIFVGYCPHSGLPDERARFWASLRKVHRAALADPSVTSTWTTGDLNSRCPTRTIPDQVGECAPDDALNTKAVATASQELEEYMREFNLYSVHTQFQNPATYVGTRGGESTIDYMLVSENWKGRATQGGTLDKDAWPIDDRQDQDHRAVGIEWGIKGSRKTFFGRKPAQDEVVRMKIKRVRAPKSPAETERYLELVDKELTTRATAELHRPTGLRDVLHAAANQLEKEADNMMDADVKDEDLAAWAKAERGNARAASRLGDTEESQKIADDAEMSDERLAYELTFVDTVAGKRTLQVVEQRS